MSVRAQSLRLSAWRMRVLVRSTSPGVPTVAAHTRPMSTPARAMASATTVVTVGTLLRSSTVIALSVVPAAVVCATLAGYALATMDVPGGRRLATFFLLGLSIPTEITVIPLYYDLRAAGLTNTVPGLALAEIGAFMPFGVFWMRAHFSTMPRSLIEAARLDGASSWTTLWRVLLPNSRPAVTTLGVLYFVWSWNQFLLPLILIQDPAKHTAPAGLGFFTGRYGVDVPLPAAAVLIVIAPVVLVYLFFQRHFISGVLSGALKG
jgi:ABC-type glycerol-3-phosphate transport system permease component